MKKTKLTGILIIASALAISAGCMNREPAPVCPVPTELVASRPTIGGFDGVDMLVVVDNSNSMAEEQQILATAFFPLINSLVNPLPNATEDPTDSIRIAITSTNMGLQWGYPANAYKASDGFPPALINAPPAACLPPKGDDGNLINSYDFNPVHGGEVVIIEGMIPCDATEVQCPTGWICEAIGTDGIGECNDPNNAPGDLAVVNCPPSPGEKGSNYLTLGTGEDASGTPLYTTKELALATACLSKLGTAGCGFEQQLVAAAVALEKDSAKTDINQRFMREKSLLVILQVSDEEDCSIEDGPNLFKSDEVQRESHQRINTACGENPEFLFKTDDLVQRYRAAKAKVSGAGGGILFAAIVGVPQVDDCQGTGNSIGNCLSHADMQPEIVWDADKGIFVYDYACVRAPGGVTVTEAAPGIRFVETAQSMGALGYVYSICNEDWSPAMTEIARLIAANIAGTCYAKPLDVDPATNTAYCNTVIKYFGLTACPTGSGLNWAHEEQVGTDELPIMACTIPKIPTNPVCPEPGTPEDAALKEIAKNEFGWYYCENKGENFSDACSDGIDNDFDGSADCDDSKCHYCKNCAEGAGVSPDVNRCPLKCRYMMTLTDKALAQAKNGTPEVQCLQQFSFEDPNCQENTWAACNDGLDNDGNGPYDCVNVTADQATDDNPARNADPYCCPIPSSQAKGQPCQVTPEQSRSICDTTDAWSDACKAAASLYQCSLPDWE